MSYSYKSHLHLCPLQQKSVKYTLSTVLYFLACKYLNDIEYNTGRGTCMSAKSDHFIVMIMMECVG